MSEAPLIYNGVIHLCKFKYGTLMSDGVKKIEFFNKFDNMLLFAKSSDIQGNLTWVWKSSSGVFMLTHIELSLNNPYTQNKFFSIRRVVYPDGDIKQIPIFSKKVEINTNGIITSVARD